MRSRARERVSGEGEREVKEWMRVWRRQVRGKDVDEGEEKRERERGDGGVNTVFFILEEWNKQKGQEISR